MAARKVRGVPSLEEIAVKAEAYSELESAEGLRAALLIIANNIRDQIKAKR